MGLSIARDAARLIGTAMSSVKDAAEGRVPCRFHNGTAIPGSDCSRDSSALRWSMIGVGLVATVVAIALATLYARRELRRQGLASPVADDEVNSPALASDSEVRCRPGHERLLSLQHRPPSAGSES